MWRLRRYVRPYRAKMAVMLFVALGSTLIGVGVPLLTSSIINGPLASGPLMIELVSRGTPTPIRVEPSATTNMTAILTW